MIADLGEQFVFSPLEGVLAGNLDTDRQLLEASKSGDLETVKVNSMIVYFTEHIFCHQRSFLNCHDVGTTFIGKTIITYAKTFRL